MTVKINKNIYNRAYTIFLKTNIIAHYNKIHLFPLMNEDKIFSPDINRRTFKIKEQTIGIIICYDLSFQEFSRALTILYNCKIIIPSGWSSKKEYHRETSNMAKAIENQVYFCAVNRAGVANKNSYFSHSIVANSNCDIIAEADRKEDVITIDLNLNVLNTIRRELPLINDYKNHYKEY